MIFVVRWPGKTHNTHTQRERYTCVSQQGLQNLRFIAMIVIYMGHQIAYLLFCFVGRQLPNIENHWSRLSYKLHQICFDKVKSIIYESLSFKRSTFTMKFDVIKTIQA